MYQFMYSFYVFILSIYQFIHVSFTFIFLFTHQFIYLLFSLSHPLTPPPLYHPTTLPPHVQICAKCLTPCVANSVSPAVTQQELEQYLEHVDIKERHKRTIIRNWERNWLSNEDAMTIINLYLNDISFDWNDYLQKSDDECCSDDDNDDHQHNHGNHGNHNDDKKDKVTTTTTTTVQNQVCSTGCCGEHVVVPLLSQHGPSFDEAKARHDAKHHSEGHHHHHHNHNHHDHSQCTHQHDVVVKETNKDNKQDNAETQTDVTAVIDATDATATTDATTTTTTTTTDPVVAAPKKKIIIKKTIIVAKKPGASTEAIQPKTTIRRSGLKSAVK